MTVVVEAGQQAIIKVGLRLDAVDHALVEIGGVQAPNLAGEDILLLSCNRSGGRTIQPAWERQHVFAPAILDLEVPSGCHCSACRTRPSPSLIRCESGANWCMAHSTLSVPLTLFRGRARHGARQSWSRARWESAIVHNRVRLEVRSLLMKNQS